MWVRRRQFHRSVAIFGAVLAIGWATAAAPQQPPAADPVLSPDAVPADPARGPNAVPNSPALWPDQTNPSPVYAPDASDSLAPLQPIFPNSNQ